MRMRLSVVGCLLTAAVAVVGLRVGYGPSDEAASAAGTAAKGVAGGAVGGCGKHCFLLYARRPGLAFTMNVAMAANNGTGGRVGRKINLRSAADHGPDGDFTMSFIGRVSQFCGSDTHDFFSLESYVCTRDSDFWVFEAQWAPYGNSTGLCAGLAAPNLTGESITLRRCGVNDRTLWIANQANGTDGHCRGPEHYCPWMNASDNNFRNPQVLTMDGATLSPGNQLRLAPQNLLPPGNNGRAWNNQEFAYFWRTVLAVQSGARYCQESDSVQKSVPRVSEALLLLRQPYLDQADRSVRGRVACSFRFDELTRLAAIGPACRNRSEWRGNGQVLDDRDDGYRRNSGGGNVNRCGSGKGA